MLRPPIRRCSDMECYRVEDIMRILDVSRAKGYQVIKELNAELQRMGYCTVTGRVTKKIFHEKYYCDMEAPSPPAIREGRN